MSSKESVSVYSTVLTPAAKYLFAYQDRSIEINYVLEQLNNLTSQFCHHMDRLYAK